MSDTDARRGDWIQTHTGRRVWPLDMRPDDIDIRDIAHALAMKCRFGGHTSQFYSVAQHSVLVARVIGEREPGQLALRLWALLHDAGEAYLCDVPRPIKPFLYVDPEGRRYPPGFITFREAEARVMDAVRVRFDLAGPEPPEVIETDTAILADEARSFMGGASAERWSHLGPPLGLDIHPWGPATAEQEFLVEFSLLALRLSPYGLLDGQPQGA